MYKTKKIYIPTKQDIKELMDYNICNPNDFDNI